MSFEFDGNSLNLKLGASVSEQVLGVSRLQIEFQLFHKSITPPTAVTLSLQGCRKVIDSGNGPVSIANLVTGTSAAEKIKNSEFGYHIAQANNVKAAAETVFSEAHVVTASKFGAIAVYINAGGDILTEINETTQTTAQAYDTFVAALDKIEANVLPDDNILIGIIVIQAGGSDWTANTHDLTPASDLAAVRYINKLSCFTDIDTHELSEAELLDGKGVFYSSEQKPDSNYRVAVIANDVSDKIKITGTLRPIS